MRVRFSTRILTFSYVICLESVKEVAPNFVISYDQKHAQICQLTDPTNCDLISRQKTMVIGRNITQEAPKPKAWKKRHADMIVMLARGYDCNGRLSHELKSLIKTKFRVHDTTIRRVWNKYKTQIMSSEAPIIERKA